ncbi:hypothetical protein QTP88_024774 [Uroleucon formosanum]
MSTAHFLSPSGAPYTSRHCWLFQTGTSRSLSLLPIRGSLMTAVLVFPACLMINKYGTCLHLSAICQSMGVVEMTPLIITMSAQWFPKNERNMMATGQCLCE